MKFKLLRLLMASSFRERPLRVLLSTFGIVLGVASVLAIGLTNRAALDSVTELVQDTTGRSQLVIVSAASGGADDTLPENSLTRAERLEEVAMLAPVLQVSAVLAGDAPAGEFALDLLAGFGEGGGLLLWGIDPGLDVQMREYGVVDGRFLDPLNMANEIVLVDTFAAAQELLVGDWVEILTPTGLARMKLVGLISEEGAGRQNNGAFGVLHLERAQTLFEKERALSQIDIITTSPDASGQEFAALKARLQAGLGPEFDLINPAAQGDRAKQMLGSYQIGLNFLSGMALFVGAFLIYNAFSMTVVERTREFGMLRTVGMTREQVILLVLTEAALLGLIGSALGVGLGLLLSRGFTAIYELLMQQDLTVAELPPDLLLGSSLVGLVVTIVAAAVPALQAGRISPLEALRVRGNVKDGWIIRRGWWLGAALLLVSTVILVWNPFPYDPEFRLGTVVVVTLFLGGVLIIPASVTFWEKATQLLVRLIYGNSGKLGSMNIRRAKMRTTLTVASLMVGISMMVVVWIMTESFKIDLEDWLEGYIGGDIFITSSANLREELDGRLQTIPGVAAVAPVRYFPVTWLRPDGAEEEIFFMATEPEAYDAVTSFLFDQLPENGAPEAAMERLQQPGNVFISSVIAEKYDLVPGQTITLQTKTGLEPFMVAAVVVDFYNQGMVVQGNWGDMERQFRQRSANAILVKVTGRDVVDVQDEIEQRFGDRYHLILESSAQIQASVSRLIDQAYSVFDILAFIAMFVAFMAIMNTLTMNVMERIQEIGMLRSIGMLGRQVVMMILAEAGVVGLMGGTIGLIFGIILGRIFLLSMTAMSGYKVAFVLPVSRALLGLLLGVVVAHLAALFPSRRATGVEILEAIHQE